jgi:RNA-directed DNA polymerase
MTTGPQKSTAGQLDFFTEGWLRDPRLDRTASGGTGCDRPEGRQADTAADHTRALTTGLLDRVLTPANITEAYHRVRSNGGAPGIDGMTVEDLGTWLARHRDELTAAVLATGPSRCGRSTSRSRAGAPAGSAALDRLLQQAILWSPISTRTSRTRASASAPDAAPMMRCARPRPTGHGYVVDLDLEKFFDRTTS